VLILFVWLLLGGGLLVYANRRLGRLG